MRMRTTHLVISAIVLAAVLILPVGTKACWVSITATNLTGSQTLNFTDDTLNGGIENAQILEDTYFDLKLSSKADPEIGVEFGVRAGLSDTTFTVLSGMEIFTALTNPDAYASAGVTLTDRTPSGATIKGLFAGGKTNQAMYNGTTAFANLVSGFSVSGSSLTKEEEYGNEFSMVPINDTLTSIESNFYFTLSARDAASGTSAFVVVPEPVTFTLLGLGTLVLRRRK